MKAYPRDIEVRTMKVRHIGIENELAIGHNHTGYLPDEAQKRMERHGLLQGVGNDGGGREFRTNPISVRSIYQIRGHKYVKEYYETLKVHSKVIETGGTHIHISILNSDHEDMEAHTLAISTAFFTAFQKICGRKTHWACRLRGVNNLDGVKEYVEDVCEGGRTYARDYLMITPTGHQTMEMRGPVGSNDGDEILAWAEFLKNVVERANHKNIDGLKFTDLLKGERISKYVEGLKGWRRLTKTELNQTLNVNAL